MNILIWSPFLQKVGTTTNVLNLINSINKYSKKDTIKIDLLDVYGEWDNYEFDRIKVNKISLLKDSFLKKIKKNGFIRSRLVTILIIILSVIPLTRQLKKKNYSFFFVHLITSLPIILTKFIKKDTRLVLNIAGFPKLTFLRSLFWKHFQNRIYKVICPSKETKNLLTEKKIFDQEKLIVIKDPHINVREIAKKKNALSDVNFNLSKNIITIGRLTKQKNYIFLLEAFKNILSIKNDIHLTIIGEGEDRNLIENKIRDLGIIKNVTLEGYQKNIYKYLDNPICYFSTSLWEGPDLAMLDAAFLNVPIICSDCKSGRKEFIENNKRGYIFKTNDMNSLISTFELFFRDNDLVIKKKLLEAKREVKNFTQFRYYLSLKKILI
jgi:glycosyltransferase involved in cell wall biosynthesis